MIDQFADNLYACYTFEVTVPSYVELSEGRYFHASDLLKGSLWQYPIKAELRKMNRNWIEALGITEEWICVSNW